MIKNLFGLLRSTSRLGVLCTLVACHATPTSQTAKAATSPAPPRSELCRYWGMTTHGPVCFQSVTADAQLHSDAILRFEYDGPNVARRVQINGRGALEPDDDDCTEYRYRYQQGVLSESTGYRQDGSVCDHTLFSDNAGTATLVDAWGRQVASKEQLHTQERFKRNSAGFSTNIRFFGRDGTPVKAPIGAHELRSERDARGRQTGVCYFDERGEATTSNDHVHCARYRFDEQGNTIETKFFDLRDQPAETSTGTHRIAFEYDAFGNVTGKRFLRADGTPISTENGPCAGFRFQYDERGFRNGGDCLDGAGRPARWREGNASWRASPDAHGHLRESRDFDPEGNPFTRSAGFARYEVDRDASGHVTEWRYFLVNGNPGQKRGAAIIRAQWNAQNLEVRRRYFDASGEPFAFRGCASLEKEYNEFRQLTRQTCRGADSKLAASTDGTAVTEWIYDSRGLFVEMRFYNAKNQPGRSQDGLAVEKLTLNALGVEAGAVLLAADGRQIHLPRFRRLSVNVAQPNEFWPARTREASRSLIETARSKLLAGLDFTRALYEYGDDTVDRIHPGDMGYQDISRFYGEARMAVEPLAVGQYSDVVELPFGFTVYQRTE